MVVELGEHASYWEDSYGERGGVGGRGDGNFRRDRCVLLEVLDYMHCAERWVLLKHAGEDGGECGS